MIEQRRSAASGDERRKQILERVGQRGFASVAKLAESLEVSEMTIRRDLGILASQGQIARHHGGASAEADAIQLEIPFYWRRRVHLAEKALIAQQAAQLLRPDEVIFLDSGTTTLEVVPHLNQERLAVFTNSLPALHLLARSRHIQLHCIGGELLSDNQCFVGSEAVAAVEKLYADVAVMATTCLSIERGLTNRISAEAQLKAAMIRNAGRVILVMESAKFNRQTLYPVCDIGEVDTLVTDAGMSTADIARIEASGVQVIIAQAPPAERANGNK